MPLGSHPHKVFSQKFMRVTDRVSQGRLWEDWLLCHRASMAISLTWGNEGLRHSCTLGVQNQQPVCFDSDDGVAPGPGQLSQAAGARLGRGLGFQRQDNGTFSFTLSYPKVSLKTL